MNKAIILCVDDEKIILDSLRNEIKHIFSGLLKVEIAESGDEALELLKQFKKEEIEVPIIISDYIMPGINGDTFLIESKNIMPSSKRILLTGQASNEGVGNAMINAGLYRFIEKPWDKNDLELTLNEAFRSFYKEKSIKANENRIEQLKSVIEFTLEEKSKEENKLDEFYNEFYSVTNSIITYMISKFDKRIYQRIQRINNIGYRICSSDYPELTPKFELANLITHSSIVNLDKYLLKNYFGGRKLPIDDIGYIKDKMAFSFYLIENWKFLDDISDGIKNMFETFELIENTSKTEESKAISKILKITNEYDNMILRGVTKTAALGILEEKYNVKEPELIKRLNEIELNIISESDSYEIVKASNLKVGMVLYSDILEKNNSIMLKKGEILDHDSLINISRLAKKNRIVEPIKIEKAD